jgi:hypothetical protein
MLSSPSGGNPELGSLSGRTSARAEGGRTRWKCRSLADSGDHATSLFEMSSSRSYVEGELTREANVKNL